MSRVLLFVQSKWHDGSWAGRPKCVSRRIEWTADVRLKMQHDPLSVRIGDAFRRADRWWLVECENAEAGRRVIENGTTVMFEQDKYGGKLVPQVFVGRILASGGQSDD